MIIIDWNNITKNHNDFNNFLHKNRSEHRKQFVIKFSKSIEKYISTLHKNSISLFYINNNLLLMSFFCELSYFKTPKINDALKFFIIKKFIRENKNEKIQILNFPYTLKKSLFYEIDDKKQIIFKKFRRFKFNKLYKFFPHIIQSLSWIVKLIYFNRTLLREKSTFNNFDTVIFSSFTHLKSYTSENFQSNIWNKFPNYLKSKYGDLCFIHFHDHLKPIGETKNLIKKYNKGNNKEFHLLFLNFLNYRLLYKSLLDYFRIYLRSFFLLRKLKKHLLKENFFSIYKLLNFEIKSSLSGIELLKNIIYCNLFLEISKSLCKTKSGFFLFEGQGWEKSLINSWNSCCKGPLIGIQHTTIPFWDLRVFNNLFFKNQKLLIHPEYYAVNSNYFKNKLIEFNYDNNKIFLTEAFRYQDIVPIEKNKPCNDLLIIGSNSLEETEEMLNAVLNSKHFFQKIYFKPHPTKLLNIKDYKVQISQKNLNYILNKVDLAVCPSSSNSSLDVYLSNVKLLIFNRKSEFQLNFLQELENIKTFSNSNDFIDSISDFKKEKASEIFIRDHKFKNWDIFLDSI